MLLAQAREEQYCIQICASITALLHYKYKEKQVGKRSMCKDRVLEKKIKSTRNFKHQFLNTVAI